MEAPQPTGLEIPTVSPVGVLQQPASDTGEVAPRPLWQRLLALAFLAFFFLATVLTSVLSSGAYCLTSHGGDTRALHQSPVYQELAAEPSTGER